MKVKEKILFARCAQNAAVPFFALVRVARCSSRNVDFARFYCQARENNCILLPRVDRVKVDLIAETPDVRGAITKDLRRGPKTISGV